MKGFIILLGQIFIELIIITHYKLHDRLFSRNTIHFLSILYSIFNTFIFLRKFPKIITIIIISLDYLIGKFIISQFYDSSCKYFDSMHSLVIIFITLISFGLLPSNKDFKKFDQHSTVKIVNLTYSNFLFVYKTYFFYRSNHLKSSNSIEFNFDFRLLRIVFTDYLANSLRVIMMNFIYLIFNPKKKKRNIRLFISFILRKFLLLFLANFFFYSVYSFRVARTVFEIAQETIPHPHNIIFYNISNMDLDKRFRMILYVINWICY
jgi:hypothetical protein